MISDTDYLRVTEKYREFLGNTAEAVTNLIVDPAKLKEFQRRIIPLAHRWKARTEAQQKAADERNTHWLRVKADPRLQDKEAGPLEDGVEWDHSYLEGLPPFDGPLYEMPAKYGQELMNSLDRHLRNLREKERPDNPSGLPVVLSTEGITPRQRENENA